MGYTSQVSPPLATGPTFNYPISACKPPLDDTLDVYKRISVSLENSDAGASAALEPHYIRELQVECG